MRSSPDLRFAREPPADRGARARGERAELDISHVPSSGDGLLPNCSGHRRVDSDEPVLALLGSPPPKSGVRLRSAGDSPLRRAEGAVDLDMDGSLRTAQGADMRLVRRMDPLELVDEAPVIRDRPRDGEAPSTEGGELRSLDVSRRRTRMLPWHCPCPRRTCGAPPPSNRPALPARGTDWPSP